MPEMMILDGRIVHACESCGAALEEGEVVVCENRDGYWYHFRAESDTHWDGATNHVAEGAQFTEVGERVPRHVISTFDVRS